MPNRFNDRENGESSYFPRHSQRQERHRPEQNFQSRPNEWREWESDEHESNLGERERFNPSRQPTRSSEPYGSSGSQGEYGPAPRRAHKGQNIEESYGSYPGQQYERGVYGYESPGDERFPNSQEQHSFRERRGFEQNRPYDPNYRFRQTREEQQFGRQEQSWDQERNFDYGSGQRHSEYEQGRFFGRGPKGYRRSDERILEDINERLTQHPFIDATEIEVHVQNAEVVLSGTVNDRHAKRMAEDIAESVSGVKEVQNQIRFNKHTEQKK